MTKQLLHHDEAINTACTYEITLQPCLPPKSVK